MELVGVATVLAVIGVPMNEAVMTLVCASLSVPVAFCALAVPPNIAVPTATLLTFAVKLPRPLMSKMARCVPLALLVASFQLPPVDQLFWPAPGPFQMSMSAWADSSPPTVNSTANPHNCAWAWARRKRIGLVIKREFGVLGSSANLVPMRRN